MPHAPEPPSHGALPPSPSGRLRAVEAAALPLTGTSRATPRQRRVAIVALSIVVLLWGTTFWANKQAMAAIDVLRDARGAGRAAGGGHFTPLLFTGLRLGIVALLFPLLFPRVLRRLNRRAVGYGFALASIFVAGFVAQSYGLVETSPAVSAFLTSLYLPFTPIGVFVLTRVWPGRAILWGMLIAVAGVALLTAPWTAFAAGDAHGFGWGELLGVLCAAFFAVHIVLTDHCTRREDPLTLTFLMLGFGALLVLAPLPLFPGARALVTTDLLPSIFREPDALAPLLLTVIGGTLIAFPLLNAYQRYLDPTQAGVIYAMEPVWAAAFSVALATDRLSAPLLVGGGLIVLGNLVAELPNLLRHCRKTTASF